jgi:hypothetical protein
MQQEPMVFLLQPNSAPLEYSTRRPVGMNVVFANICGIAIESKTNFLGHRLTIKQCTSCLRGTPVAL